MNVFIMGAPQDGREPALAWQEYRRQLIEDEYLRGLIRDLAGVTGVRKLLDESRRGWRALGYEAPFDFLFDKEEAHGQGH